MAEDGPGQIVDRIEREGQLTRNSGTNSIKSIAGRLDNFAPVFNAINSSLIVQTSLLEDAFDLQARAVAAAEEAREDRDREGELNPPPEPPPTPEDTPDSKKDKKAFKDMLKDTFTANNIGMAIVGAVAAPFLAGMLYETIDLITSGGLTKFKDFVVNDLPDIFANLKETIALVYGNFEAFLDSGNIDDLLAGPGGQPIVDVNNLKEKATIFGGVLMSRLLLGPIGMIGSAVGFGITGAFEELTGADIPEEFELAFSTGLGLAALSTTMRGLAFRAFSRLLMTPYGLIATAIAVALGSAYKHFADKNKEQMAQDEAALQQAQALIDQGKYDEADALIKSATDLRGRDKYSRTLGDGVGISDEDEIGMRMLNRNLGYGMLEGFNEMGLDRTDPKVIDDYNRALMQVGQMIDRYDETDFSEAEKSRLRGQDFTTILENMSAKDLNMLRFNPNELLTGDKTVQMQLEDVLAKKLQLRPNQIRALVPDLLDEMKAFNQKRMDEAFIPLPGDNIPNPLDDGGMPDDLKQLFGIDPTSSRKTNFLDGLSSTGAGGMFAPVSVNSGGNVYKGGDSISNNNTSIQVRNGGDASGALFSKTIA